MSRITNERDAEGVLANWGKPAKETDLSFGNNPG